MRARWDSLRPRERLLIQAAGAFLLIALVVQGVLIPLHAAGAAAKQELATARGTIARLERLRAAGVIQVPNQDGNVDPAAVASQLGLKFERHVDAKGSGLQFRFDAAEPAVVFTWMDRVGAGTELELVMVQMVSAGEGRVYATVDFAGASSR